MSKPGIFSLAVGQEAIVFQTDGFGKDIEEIFTRIRENYKKPEDIYDCPEKKELDKLIYKRTGILAGIEFNTGHFAAVDVPTITKNHIFLDNQWRHYYDATSAVGMIDNIKKNKYHNTVNLKTAKLTGIFSDLPAVVYINGSEFMKKTLTPAEYTAILLHELGHVFVSYEFINRTSTTNQVLAAVCRTVQDKDDAKTKEIVFKEASEIVKAKTNSLTSLSNSRDLTVISTVIIKSSLDDTVSENGLAEYDATSFEALADTFATRFGYGRELISALDKIHKDQFLSAETSRLSYFVIFMFESLYIFSNLARIAMFFVVGGALLASGAYFLMLIHLLLTTMFFSVIANSGAKDKDYTYDVLKVRHTRIKEQMIERLKDKSISAKEKTACLEAITLSEKIIEDTFVYEGPMTLVTNFIFPGNRKVISSIELQRNLEALAANDFFVASAVLRSMS